MRSERMVIGITGAAGSGKSLGAKILARTLQAHIIDVDALGHKALIEKKCAIRHAFGPAVIAGNAVDRKALGALVFSSEAKLRRLERIVHPAMVRSAAAEIRKRSGTVIIDAALLYRMHLDTLCTCVIHIDAPKSELIRRLTVYRGMSKAGARRLLDRQKDIKRSFRRSDIVIKNISGVRALRTALTFAARTVCPTIIRPRRPRTSNAIS